MMKTDAVQYQGAKDLRRIIPETGIKKIAANIFNKKSIIFLSMAFLLGRASLAGGLMPFGIPVFAVASSFNISKLILAVFILLGMVTNGARQQLYIIISAMGLFELQHILIRNSKSGLNVKFAAAGLVSVMIPEMVFVASNGFLLYDLLKAIFHGAIAFTLVFVFKSAEAFFNGIKKRVKFTNEEIISISIITAIALSGLSDIHIAGLSLKHIMCILVVLVVSYKCGSGPGAAIGVTIGLIIGMPSTSTPYIIGLYGFCGLISGVLRGLGKLGPSLGFILANTIMTLYLNSSTDVLIHLKEVVLASVIFAIIPRKLMDAFARSFSEGSSGYVDRKGYNSLIKTAAAEKLNKFSGAFRELAKIFGEISETKASTDKNDISVLFDRVADRVCKDCSLCLHCWDRNFYDTYQILFSILEKLDKKGRIDAEDVPGYFLDRCERINEFVKAVNNIYEVFRVDVIWKGRIAESRGFVSRQLEGVSDVIKELAADISSDVQFNEDLEDAIANELGKIGIKPLDVVVIENRKRRYEIKISFKGCGGKRKCINTIARSISRISNRRMVKENHDCGLNSADDICTLKLVEEESYGVITGVAGSPRYGGTISGDSYTFLNVGDGKYVAALSDGMGSGPKAAIQSKATISLLEQFMDSGFGKDATVKMINSLLAAKSDDDSFATIDLSVLDLYEGNIEFLKVGAAPTFIKKPDRLETIRTISLPAGIMADMEAELIRRRIENGDFLILMTDGVVDSFNTENEDLLNKFITDLECINPQAIADTIMAKAMENCGGSPADDMTVLVAKVWKKVI